MVEGKESQAVPSVENGSLSLATERVEEGRWVRIGGAWRCRVGEEPGW